MQVILLFTACLAIFGSYLNSYGKKEGFLVWMVTNFTFMAYNIFIAEYAQVFLFACSFLISVNGWIQWSKKEAASQSQEPT